MNPTPDPQHRAPWGVDLLADGGPLYQENQTMSNRRPLSADLTDQGKYQLEHGRPVGHTPGPWVISEHHGSLSQYMIGPDKCAHVGTVTMGDRYGGRPHAEADAHLVAAAPDLLEQLKEARIWVAKVAADRAAVVREHGDHMGLMAARRLDRMDAAIAKATGASE